MPLLNDNELAPLIDAVAARLLAIYVHSHILWLLLSYLQVKSTQSSMLCIWQVFIAVAVST